LLNYNVLKRFDFNLAVTIANITNSGQIVGENAGQRHSPSVLRRRTPFP